MAGMITSKGLGRALLATTALGWALPAFADEAADDANSANAEIIVTAQRRNESLQKVPVSVQALSTATLENHNVTSFDDYAQLLPSVSYQSFGPGQSSLSFRGINSGADGLDAGPPPTTGTYLDEIPISTIAFSPDIHVYDIARVEALSGPQGTLFGASSLSGTLRIITNKPNTSKFEGGWDVGVNKYGAGNAGGSLEGFLNVPMSDRLAIRMIGFYDKKGGYIDNIPGTRVYTLDDAASDPLNLTNKTITNAALVKNNFNPVENYGGRAALKAVLSDNWTVTPQFIYQHLNSEGSFLYDPRKGDLKVTDYLPSYNHDDWWQAALTIEGKIGNWDLVYSGGYMKRKVNNEVDYSYYTVAYDTYGYYATYFPTGNPAPNDFLDPTQRQVVQYKYDKHTQELRLSSPSDAPARITVGAFYQRQSNDIDAKYVINGLGSIPQPIWFHAFGGGDFPTAPADVKDTEYLKRLARVDKDYAVFAEGSYKLSDTLTATAGIRVFWVDNSLFGFSGYSYNTGPAACLSAPGFKPWIPCANVHATADTTIGTPRRTKESGETHKINLSWQFAPTKMVYWTYSTGYRPGGVNRKTKYPPYRADKLSNWEMGWKTSFASGTVRWNGAIFYEKWDNMIFTLARPGDNGVNSLANVGGARSIGIESDVSLRFGNLELTGSASYTDAQLTTDFIDFLSGGGTQVSAPKGTRLPVQPRFKSTATARYNFDVGSSRAFVQGSVNSQSNSRSFLLADDNAVVGNSGGFTTFDFSTGVKFGNFSIEAFIENAFDTRGQLTRNVYCGVEYCGPFYRIYPTKPRLFGMKIGQRF